MSILALYGFFTFLTVIVFMGTGTNLNDFLMTPAEWYHGTRLNKFACCLAALVSSVFLPWVHVFRFIYWICHIGRRD